MIVNFSVQNFGSIKDKQTLSFEADKSTHLEDYYIIKESGNLRLLKLALIYGANASGKTTILNALDFLHQIVSNPASIKTNTLEFNPFLFDANTPNQNSVITIDFIQNKVRYVYEVEFNQNAIAKEELTFYSPNKANVFKRTTDVNKQLTAITFGSKIKKDSIVEKILESNTLWNNTVLGGYLKTNIELKELKDVTDWFGTYLKKMIYTKTNLDAYVTDMIDRNEIEKELVLSILQKADFNISNILIEKEESDVTDDILSFMDKQLKISSEKINEIKNKGKVSAINLMLEHTVDKVSYKLPFGLESQGTRRYYGFAGLLSLLVKNSVAFPIDELESSLHPELYIHFLLSFLINSQKSQLIATTHNREILSNKDIFRNDAIWFTDKSEASATQLYSLSDFDSSVVRDTSNIFNAYKSGKLGGTPNLGDYYIDISNENN